MKILHLPFETCGEMCFSPPCDMLNFLINIYRKRLNELQKLEFYHNYCIIVDRAFVSFGVFLFSFFWFYF